jgi:hypothetical protein
MAQTVVGLMENASQAEKTVEELLRSGFERKHIGIISPEIGREAAAALAGGSRGIVYGGLGGMLLGAIALAIPGIGPVIAAGPVLPLLGTVFGAIAGGLIGGLTSKEIPETDAHFYAEGLRRGGTLIIVSAKNDELAQRAREIMKQHGAAELDERVEQWAKSGWSRRFTDRESARAGASSAAPSGESQSAPSSATSAAPASSPTTSPAHTGSVTPADAPVQEVAEAEEVGARAAPERIAASPTFSLSAVRVYSFAIAMLENAHAANQPAYNGPERRFENKPFSHRERRRAA